MNLIDYVVTYILIIVAIATTLFGIAGFIVIYKEIKDYLKNF
jgi:hypothetical protein